MIQEHSDSHIANQCLVVIVKIVRRETTQRNHSPLLAAADYKVTETSTGVTSRKTGMPFVPAGFTGVQFSQFGWTCGWDGMCFLSDVGAKCPVHRSGSEWLGRHGRSRHITDSTAR